MLNNNFTTSVIIPTLNRPDTLGKMLTSLLKQTMLPDEIIIVDQSRDLDSKRITESLLQGFRNIALKYIKDSNITGAAQARNIGISNNTGEIVFFFDDDVILETEFIEKTLNVYKKCPNISGVGGVITNYNFLAKSKIKLFHKIFYHGIFLDERREIFTNFRDIKQPIFVSKLSGGCCSFRKNILDNQKFDESFDNIFHGYAFGEDIDLSMRIAKKFKLCINPNARLEHDPEKIKKECSERNNYIFLETSSLTYIFLKNFRGDLLAWACYFWLCLGWFSRCILNIFRSNNKFLLSMVRGVKTGIKLFKEKNHEINS